MRTKNSICSSSVNVSLKMDMDMSLEAFIAIVGPQSEELIKSFINAKTKIQELKIQSAKDIKLAEINASKSQVIFF